jgi:hypothetical protein
MLEYTYIKKKQRMPLHDSEALEMHKESPDFNCQ